MAKLTPEEAAAKWKNRTASAQPDWQRGVERTADSPTAKAAASATKWQTKVSAASTMEKFKRNVGAVSKEEWQTRTLAKAGNYSAGVQASEDKMLKHQRDSAAHIEAGRRMIAGMPNVTIEDAAARAAAWVRHMASYKKPA